MYDITTDVCLQPHKNEVWFGVSGIQSSDPHLNYRSGAHSSSNQNIAKQSMMLQNTNRAARTCQRCWHTHCYRSSGQDLFRNMNDAITSTHPRDADTNHWQMARPFLYPCHRDDIRTEAEERFYWWPTHTKCYFTARFSFLTRQALYV